MLLFPQEYKPLEHDYWKEPNLKLYRKLLQELVRREQESRQSKHSFGGVSSIESSGKRFKRFNSSDKLNSLITQRDFSEKKNISAQITPFTYLKGTRTTTSPRLISR